jgi:hypothetical protein
VQRGWGREVSGSCCNMCEDRVVLTGEKILKVKGAYRHWDAWEWMESSMDKSSSEPHSSRA